MDRLHFTLIIGSDTLPKENLNGIIGNLSKVYGGVTYSQRVGTWATNGEEFRAEYSNFATETAYQIDICTENMDEAQGLGIIKQEIAPLCKGFANWVRVETYVTHGLHFSVDEFLS